MSDQKLFRGFGFTGERSGQVSAFGYEDSEKKLFGGEGLRVRGGWVRAKTFLGGKVSVTGSVTSVKTFSAGLVSLVKGRVRSPPSATKTAEKSFCESRSPCQR